ncbi:hypothetical protein C8Q76DRAFT_720292 [Earliella scabrosa]|nr:hypothetical protein C8Q76DRAFT_720292 [Earliella scabrosa]
MEPFATASKRLTKAAGRSPRTSGQVTPRAHPGRAHARHGGIRKGEVLVQLLTAQLEAIFGGTGGLMLSSLPVCQGWLACSPSCILRRIHHCSCTLVVQRWLARSWSSAHEQSALGSPRMSAHGENSEHVTGAVMRREEALHRRRRSSERDLCVMQHAFHIYVPTLTARRLRLPKAAMFFARGVST